MKKWECGRCDAHRNAPTPKKKMRYCILTNNFVFFSLFRCCTTRHNQPTQILLRYTGTASLFVQATQTQPSPQENKIAEPITWIMLRAWQIVSPMYVLIKTLSVMSVFFLYVMHVCVNPVFFLCSCPWPCRLCHQTGYQNGWPYIILQYLPFLQRYLNFY